MGKMKARTKSTNEGLGHKKGPLSQCGRSFPTVKAANGFFAIGGRPSHILKQPTCTLQRLVGSRSFTMWSRPVIQEAHLDVAEHKRVGISPTPFRMEKRDQ